MVTSAVHEEDILKYLFDPRQHEYRDRARRYVRNPPHVDKIRAHQGGQEHPDPYAGGEQVGGVGKYADKRLRAAAGVPACRLTHRRNDNSRNEQSPAAAPTAHRYRARAMPRSSA